METNVHALDERLNKKEEEEKAMKKDLEEVKNKVSKMEKREEMRTNGMKDIQENMTEMTKTYSDALKQGKPENKARDEQTLIKEIEERNERKDKLVWFNIPESMEEDASDRKEEDMKYMNELGKRVFDLSDKSFANAIRLGKKSDKPRPLLTTMTDAKTATEVLQGARALGKPENKELKIAVKRDMTPLERKEQRELVQLRNTKKEESQKQGTGEIWVIRKGEVINIARRNPPQEKEEDRNKE